MASITPQLNAVYPEFSKNASEATMATFADSRKDVVTTFDRSKAINVGDQLPAFTLPDAIGNQQNSSDLLSKGPLIVTFYRGEWCPFCNIAIHGLQLHLDEYKAKGVNLVAITPEKPSQILSMTEKHELKFSVLTDLHNEYARKLGIVWKQPEALRPILKSLGHDLSKRNGDDTLEVPIPATMLIDKEGKVRNLFLEPDYVKRVEPTTVLQWIDEL